LPRGTLPRERLFETVPNRSNPPVYWVYVCLIGAVCGFESHIRHSDISLKQQIKGTLWDRDTLSHNPIPHFYATGPCKLKGSRGTPCHALWH
jgi:hypothetical protein